MNLDEDTLTASMAILSIAKKLYDGGKLERLFEVLGEDVELCWENQWLVEKGACLCVFQDAKVYEHEGSRYGYEEEREVYVLRDPLLTRFDKLCLEYELRHGISRIENTHASYMNDVVASAMRLPTYCYNYLWIDGSKDRKGPKLVIILLAEFVSYEDLVWALCQILEACEDMVRLLERELQKPADKVLPLQQEVPAAQKEGT